MVGVFGKGEGTWKLTGLLGGRGSLWKGHVWGGHSNKMVLQTVPCRVLVGHPGDTLCQPLGPLGLQRDVQVTLAGGGGS